MKFLNRHFVLCVLLNFGYVSTGVRIHASPSQSDTGNRSSLLETQSTLNGQNFETIPTVPSELKLLLFNPLAIHNKHRTSSLDKVQKDVKPHENQTIVSIAFEYDPKNENRRGNTRIPMEWVPDFKRELHHVPNSSDGMGLDQSDGSLLVTNRTKRVSDLPKCFKFYEIGLGSKRTWVKITKNEAVIHERSDNRTTTENFRVNNLSIIQENREDEELLNYDIYGNHVDASSTTMRKSITQRENMITSKYGRQNPVVHKITRISRRKLNRKKRHWLETHNEKLENFENNTVSRLYDNRSRLENKKPKNREKSFHRNTTRKRSRLHKYKSRKNMTRSHDSFIHQNHRSIKRNSKTLSSHSPKLRNSENYNENEHNNLNYNYTNSGPSISNDDYLHNYNTTDNRRITMNYNNSDYRSATMNNYNNSDYRSATMNNYNNSDYRSATMNNYNNSDYRSATMNNYNTSDERSINTGFIAHTPSKSLVQQKRIKRRRRGRRRKEDLSLYIDQDQVQRLSGERHM
ncbi:hypothetical protein FHG87_014412 [Trinorchestia longiramus]|nr:hypothetical protein FHG87_014412 [Trinorchestia longiramus]